MGRFVWAKYVAYVSLILVAACSGGTEDGGATACTVVADCATGQVCAGGACGACSASAQCAADYGSGATCDAGVCHAATCTPGAVGCTCYDNGTCDEGVRCESGECVACPEGAAGCACYPNDTCDTATCLSGVCVDCTTGAAGCSCAASACGAGNVCAGGTCVACADGMIGCPCTEAGTCTGGVCAEGLCEACVDGRLGCPCGAAGQCDAGGRCADSTCVACVDGVIGCPCAAGACDGGRCIDDLCEACVAGAAGCPCAASEPPCDAGNRCEADVCVACTAGTLGCPCDAGACASGECVADVCTDCTAGQIGCACYPNGTCSAGGACQDGVCTGCTPGAQKCPCDAGACDSGLVCTSGLCVSESCQEGLEDCPCGDADNCQGDTVCDGGLCTACGLHLAGCPCQGACIGALVCDDEDKVCRAPQTCEAACAPHQGCDASKANADPDCLESCDDGWAWDAASGSCTLAVTATCTAGVPGSLAKDCAAAHRACTDGPDGAFCGDCSAGYTDVGGTLEDCRLWYTCVDLNCTKQHRGCTPGDNADAVCGACDSGYIEDALVCRPVKSCEDLGCVYQNRGCTEGNATTDAVCTECLDGYLLDGVECRATKSCLDLACASQNRSCQAASAHADAVCGGCDDGFTEESGLCRAVVSCAQAGCADLSRECVQATTHVDAVCGDCLAYTVTVDGENACRPVLSCDSAGCTGDHRVCTAATALSDATCGDCDTGYVAVDGTTACRAVETCESLACTSRNRDCTPAVGTTDAVCGDCLSDFVEDGAVCVVAPPTCTVGAPGSIVDTCTAGNRDCDEPAGGTASCGDCANGYAETAAGACAIITTCESLSCSAKNRKCSGTWPFQFCGDCFAGTVASATDESYCTPPQTCDEVDCGDDEFCFEGDGVTTGAKCVVNTCLDGEAYSEYAGGCVPCIVTCGDDEGETGQVWPETLADSQACICETEKGYYWDEGGTRSAAPCDADGDGWVRDDARTYLESDDDTLVQNARCDLRTIDRFVLQNELGQRLQVYLCDGDPELLREGTGETCEFGLKELDLYETTRNDDQSELEQASLAPTYAQAGVGRRFRASEVNPLTRACIKGADLNDNGLSDISEWHGMSQGSLSSEEYIYQRFAYYMELHTSYYESGTDSLTGQYVIAERSRCDADFPLGYGDTVSSTYWQGCTRSRDASYDATDGDAGPEFGLDFAAWSCDDTSGSCPIPPPPTDTVPSSAAPEHNLCNVYRPIADDDCDDSSSPWTCLDGGVWRGMNHSSQFRCVVVDDDESTTEPHVATNDFYPTGDGKFLLNQCSVKCSTSDKDCSDDCASGTCLTSSVDGDTQPSDPVLECTVKTEPKDGDVGFVAVLFQDQAGNYERGCIDEWTPTAITGNDNGSEDTEVSAWRALCPGYLSGPDTVSGQGNQIAFGEIQCGCGNNYGGTECDAGCPSEQLHLSPTYESTPRTGWWMCADFSATAFATEDATEGPKGVGSDSAGSKWVLTGEVDGTAAGNHMCETATCDALGLTPTNFGSWLVCGATPDCNATASTHAEAEALCEANGMRLCTSEEMGNNETQDSGCNFNYVAVWTSTACDGGYVTQAGYSGSLTDHPVTCQAATETAAVRCCADTCEATGWRVR